MDRYELRRQHLLSLKKERCNDKIAELAKTIGRDASYVSRMLYPEGKKAKKRISEMMVEVIETSFNLPKGYLDSPLDSELPEANAEVQGEIDAWDGQTPLGEDEIEVPFYADVHLSAGSGTVAEKEQTNFKLRFAKSTLRRYNVPPECAVCVKVTGNSMEPVLPDGSTVGVDTSSVSINDGKMYAINHAGELRVKTLYKMPGGGLRVRSYNVDEHPEEIYDQDQATTIIVLGRVFWYSVML
jgi:phage repressor protein C with HTH and peptisase S24 domain